MLRRIREAATLTRDEQALLLQAAQGDRWFDPENLKRWETERRLPTPRWHQLLADGYGLAVEEVARAVAASRRWRKLHQQPVEDEGEEDTAVNRRQFLGAAALATGVVALPGIAEARQGIDAGLSGSDAGDLAYLDGAFERHRGGYHGRAPGVVLAQMRQDLGLLEDVLSRSPPAGTRVDLARTAAATEGQSRRRPGQT